MATNGVSSLLVMIRSLFVLASSTTVGTMYTRNSSYRTWATAAAVLFLLAGLCSAASGPIAAGAEESEASLFGEFAESKANSFEFAESWLFLEPADTPISGEPLDEPSIDDPSDGPNVASRLELRGCDSSPELLVKYTITSDVGISEMRLSGMIGDEWFNRSVDFEPGDTSVTLTEAFALTDLKNDTTSWNTAWILLDAFDSSAGATYDSIDIEIDFAKCAFDEFLVDHGPEVVSASVVLSECATAPKLTATYTVRHDDGIARVNFSSTEQQGAKTLDIQVGSQSLTVTETVDVQALKDGGQTDTYLGIDSFSTSGYWSEYSELLILDFDTCTYESHTGNYGALFRDFWDVPSGDGPEIVVESVGLSECATSPELTVNYTVRDSDGIDEVVLFSDISYALLDIEVGATELSITEAVDVESMKAVNNTDINIILDATDSLGGWNSDYQGLVFDFEACKVEFYDDVHGPTKPEPPEVDGPLVEFSNFRIEKCDTSAEVSFDYLVADDRGISGIETYSSMWENITQVPPPNNQTEVRGRTTLVLGPESSEYDDHNVEFAVYNEHDYSWGHQDFTIDLESCELELGEFYRFN